MRQKQILWIAAFAVVLIAQSASPALAQQVADPVIGPLDERVKLFLEEIKQGSQVSIENAYQNLLAGGRLGSQSEKWKTMVQTTEQIDDLYGEYRSFEQVYAKRIGTDLVFLKYLYKCSSFPVLWHVTFYRAPVAGERGPDTSGSWQVVAIRFDTDLEVLTLLKE
jgi:hypothetical protein